MAIIDIVSYLKEDIFLRFCFIIILLQFQVFAIFDLVVVILAIIAVTVNRDDHPELENEESK